MLFAGNAKSDEMFPPVGAVEIYRFVKGEKKTSSEDFNEAVISEKMLTLFDV